MQASVADIDEKKLSLVYGSIDSNSEETKTIIIQNIKNVLTFLSVDGLIGSPSSLE